MFAALFCISLILPAAGPSQTRLNEISSLYWAKKHNKKAPLLTSLLAKNHADYLEALELARSAKFDEAQKQLNAVGLVTWLCGTQICPLDFERASIKLKGLFAPSTHEELHYATLQSAFSLSKASEVFFRLGSNAPLSLWIDGHEVFAQSQKPACRIDQEEIKLLLSAGVHQVALRVVNQPDAEIMMRIDDGKRPLKSDTRLVQSPSSAPRPTVISAQNLARLLAPVGATTLEESAQMLELISRHSLPSALEKPHQRIFFKALATPEEKKEPLRRSQLFARAADATSAGDVGRVFFEAALALDEKNALAHLGLGELLFSARAPKAQGRGLRHLELAQSLAPSSLEVQRRAFKVLAQHAHHASLDAMLIKRALLLNDPELAALALLTPQAQSEDRATLMQIVKRWQGKLSARFSPGDAARVREQLWSVAIEDPEAAVVFAQSHRESFSHALWAYELEIEARRRWGEDSPELEAFIKSAHERFANESHK